LIFHIFGALAEFERDIIKERTNAGLAAARSRGRTGGRRKMLSPKEIAMVRQLYADKKTPIADICRSFGGSRMTLWRYVKETKSPQ
jgi:DNA invertase Pin-like site-specific DNA recombinase